MNRKIINQNKTFITVILVLSVIFCLVLYFGGSQIYKREAQWQHGKTIAQLLSGTKIIEEYFSEFERNLLFIRDLPSTIGYVDSNYESIYYQKVEEKIFRDFVRVYKKYSQIKVLDAAGHEIIRIDNRRDGATTIAPGHDLQDHGYHPHFQEAMQLDKDQMCSSSIGATIDQEKMDGPFTPVISLSTPLFNSKKEKKGVLILDVFFSKVLEFLPENMFIQTEEGNRISLTPDGSINYDKSDYVFRDRSGWLYYSETETIHYTTVEFLPGKSFIVGIFHSHPLLKVDLQRLIFISILLLVLFFCLILVIGYINISRFRSLIGAQKAIIFSLVRLTESRDQETGNHLERTRNYTIILARQLRKKKSTGESSRTNFLAICTMRHLCMI